MLNKANRFLFLYLFLAISIIEKFTMLKVQLHNSQQNTSIGVEGRTFGIQYYTIRNKKLGIYDIPCTKGRNITKVAAQYQASYNGLVVFIYQASESIHDSFPDFCKEQITSIVGERKLSFILCFNHIDDMDHKNSIEIKSATLKQLKKIVTSLQTSLGRTHWIIRSYRRLIAFITLIF